MDITWESDATGLIGRVGEFRITISQPPYRMASFWWLFSKIGSVPVSDDDQVAQAQSSKWLETSLAPILAGARADGVRAERAEMIEHCKQRREDAQCRCANSKQSQNYVAAQRYEHEEFAYEDMQQWLEQRNAPPPPPRGRGRSNRKGG
jgi:hypothetical protein